MQTLTAQQETLLTIKWGGDFHHELIKAWFVNNDAGFTELERNIVFDWVRKSAGE
jgi:hypothetical protein